MASQGCRQPSLDKEAEYEADGLAMVLAARAGYGPFGLPIVLQELGHLSKDNGSVSLLFKTHPLRKSASCILTRPASVWMASAPLASPPVRPTSGLRFFRQGAITHHVLGSLRGQVAQGNLADR